MTTACPPDDKSLKYLKNTLNVSRETLEQLQLYAELTLEWQKAINLVSPATLPELWWRHIVDSAQLYPLLPKGATRQLDFGSGAGFPGLVMAILGVPNVTLVESDQRKSIFMREVARQTGITVMVLAQRLEKLAPQQADIVTARALAPLKALVEWGRPHANAMIFPKGRDVQEEIKALSAEDQSRIRLVPSITEPQAGIVCIGC